MTSYQGELYSRTVNYNKPFLPPSLPEVVSVSQFVTEIKVHKLRIVNQTHPTIVFYSSQYQNYNNGRKKLGSGGVHL